MQTTTYDAAGRRVAFRDRWRMSASASEETETQFVYDGDGRPVVERHGSRTINTPTPPPMVVATTGYQVWSSVLGTSLTSVNTNGEKVETKVFAGGTHIATQHEMNPATTSDDSLIFVTADPVTGSVARYSGSGASADIEESEPLGQMIETFDPGSGYPTSYEDVRGIARDPEWQCLAAGLKRSTFNEMPVHCKKAKLAERDFYLPGALAESDPKRAAMPADGHGSPGRGTPPTLKTGQRLAPEHLTQMRALAATGKFDNEEDGPACGLTDCVVNVEAQSDTPEIDSIGAENGGAFGDCVNKAGVGSTGIHQDAADLIVKISKFEGVSLEALAVTWQWETGFQLAPLPNLNGTAKDPKRYISDTDMWDVGPFHINVKWTELAIAKGEISVSDIETFTSGVSNVYGILYKPLSTATKDKSKWEPATFGGSPLASGRVAARRIKTAPGKTEAEKVSNYAPDPRDRRKKYDTWAPRFRVFFDCYLN